MSVRVSLQQQIDEVRREIAMRERVYPGQVTRGKMRQSEAAFALDRMRAVLRTLEFLQTHREAVISTLGEETGL